ncbi:MAG: TolC family protein [Acidobacteriota bacterium]
MFLLTLAFGAVSAAAQVTPPDVPSVAKNTVRTFEVTSPVTRMKPNAFDFGTITTTTRLGVQTAQPLSLTLDEAIRRALANNNDIEVSRTSERIQEQQIQSLLGQYDPVFTATPTYSRSQSTGNKATNDLRVSSNFSGFIRPGGGNYQTFFNNNRTESAFAQSQASSGTVSSGNSALYTSSLGVAYTQPLFRNLGIDSRRLNISIAKKRLEQSDTDFRLQATKTVTSVQQGYWDLVFALRNQQNVQANVTLAKENLRQIEARIDAGAAAPLERASIDTELATREGDLLSATQQVSIAENALKQLILRDPTAPEWQQSIVPVDKPVFSQDVTDLNSAMQDAVANRFELKRLKIEGEVNALNLRYYKNQLKPQVDLNTQFSLNGLSSGGTSSAFSTTLYNSTADLRLFNGINQIRALPSVNLPLLVNDSILVPASPSYLFGGFNRSLSNIFRTDAPNFSVGVTFSFPLRNRTAKADYAAAKITTEQVAAQTRGQEQVVVVDVRNAVQAVETSRQLVLTSRRARESAEIQLDGERKLYDAGRSTTFLLFQRENALTNARNAEVRAETDYNKALADLQRATATSFRAHNITVDSPVVVK